MAKPELGTKRTCQSCGSKYYDLMRDPITCPKCGAAFVAASVVTSSSIARAARADARNKVVKTDEDDVEAAEIEEDEDAEAISLEDADEETAGSVKKKVVSDDADEDDAEDDDAADDESFLEADEGDDDVTDIIGDREKDDET